MTVHFTIPIMAFDAPDKSCVDFEFRCDVDAEGRCEFSCTFSWVELDMPPSPTFVSNLLHVCRIKDGGHVSDQPTWLAQKIADATTEEI